MGALMDVLSPELTAAWVVFAMWCVVQFGWYRRVRVAPAPPQRRPDSTPRPAVAKRTMSALPTGGSPEFLAELGLSEPAAQTSSSPQPLAEQRSVYR
jgi:hypothetical protein